MGWTDLLGYLAACLTTLSFVPQAWLTFRTRDVRGISLGMYSAFTAGIALWLLYGLALSAWPIVVANTVTLVLASAILWMRWRYGGAPAPGDDPAPGLAPPVAAAATAGSAPTPQSDAAH